MSRWVALTVPSLWNGNVLAGTGIFLYACQYLLPDDHHMLPLSLDEFFDTWKHFTAREQRNLQEHFFIYLLTEASHV